ncbi:helix-turn-helix domain-containing protein [Anaerosporomusa subterranea]|uniref:helix-turn-helix domain-containing protein n=1 Tax=Anaerosporomusa subterranea TaxID=1794912 RepID=UPI000A94D27F|nr:AraC family transcriptional regulator [Anaerosporomusa subterranea]
MYEMNFDIFIMHQMKQYLISHLYQMIAQSYHKETSLSGSVGQYGITLEQLAIEGSYTYRIKNVIERLMHRYDQAFRIEDLAEMANMSVSSFHRHFKEVTAMSPLQFQKQLRLYEARRLLLSEAADAAEVTFRVGYESPSQFSREYSRMFGLPPKEDLKRVKVSYNQQTDE